MKSFLSKPTLGFQISSQRKREKENEASFVRATKREVLLVTFDRILLCVCVYSKCRLILSDDSIFNSS